MSHKIADGRHVKSKRGIGSTGTSSSPTPGNPSHFPNGQSASELLASLLGIELNPDGHCITPSQLLLSASAPETKEEHSRPLVIELFAGSFGWGNGFIAEGFRSVGFDIEHKDYHGQIPEHASLVLKDVLELNGALFKHADCIVCSPPCQTFSYMAMPWRRAKSIAAEYRSGARDVKKLTALFDACFRIQREAIEAAGHFIPMVVENVRGAQPWVGRARWNFGSYYLWGDVPALMPITQLRSVMENGVTHRASGETNFHGIKAGDRNKAAGEGGHKWPTSFAETLIAAGSPVEGFKTQGMNWSDQTLRGQDFTRIAGQQAEGLKGDGSPGGTHQWFGKGKPVSAMRMLSSKSNARKAASATIAKIPLTLSRWIARVYKPK